MNFNLSFGKLLSLCDENSRKTIRNLEKLEKKVISSNFGVKFCEVCLNEGLHPSFTNVRTYDPLVRRDEITLEYRKNLLMYKLEKHNRALEELNLRLFDARATFDSLNLNGNVRQ